MRWALAMVFAFVACEARAQERLSVASWGGSYAESQRRAAIEPFEEATGVEVDLVVHRGDFDAIRRRAEGEGSWDVIDVELADAIAGCEEGVFAPFDLDALPDGLDGAAAEDDFVDDALQRCAVGSVLWSTIWAHREGAFSGGPPETAADFFDLDEFPGKRAIRRRPQGNLEFALMADGVPPEEVYTVLRSDRGVDRAFAKLDALASDLVFWTDGEEPIEWLESGEVALATAFNGRLFAATQRGAELVARWDGQITQLEVWAVMANAPNPELAREFVNFATSTEALAAQASLIAYSPARISSYAHLDTEVLDHLPTAPSQFVGALRDDFTYWTEHRDALVERFDAWADGVEAAAALRGDQGP